MKPYEAKELIRDVFENAFDKDRYTRFIRNLLKDFEEKTFTYSGNIIPNAFENYIRKMDRIGKFEDEEGNNIDILVVELKREHSIEYARSTQRNFIRWYLGGSRGGQMKDAALVAFHSEKFSEWRFSLIKMQYSLETQKDEFTPAKRFSFLVGEKGKSHTAQQQLVKLLKSDDIPYLSDLEESFNIESVTNEFFEKYKALVFNLEESLKHILLNNPEVNKEFEEKKIDALEFSKKLMGQIVFLYFLQRKGWLGVQKGQEYGEGDRYFLRSLYNQKKVNENFFNDYLEHLFYDALNNNKRSTDFYPRFNCKIPFLNGGLFDPIGFYDWENTTINLLDDIFTNDIKTKEGDSGTGILDIFDLYNFTVNEAEPLEKEVAVDPEMLGKVFERMLDVKERKSKGAFYTPREIVHYMSQESLIHYLDTTLNDTVKSFQQIGDNQSDMFGNKAAKQTTLEVEHGTINVPKEDIETLIKHGEHFLENEEQILREGKETKTYKHQIPESIRKQAKLIDDKLRDVRVCDPAVGSGAFPVGVMTEIVKARQILDRFIDDKKDRSSYALKSHCIHHNLYGVDIDGSAVEICKLRLWLSLVVDEQRIDVIEPLPNLDYKIVRGNSLINMPDGVMRDQQLEKEIERLMEKYYAETDKQAKRDLKNEIDGEIKQLLKSAEQFTNYPIDFDFNLFFHEVFKEKNGFDVVIANPPYKMIQPHNTDKNIISILKKLYDVNFKIDLFHLFFKLGVNLAATERIICFIAPSSLLNNVYVESLRKWLLEKTKILELLNSRKHFFESADVHTTIYLLQKSQNKYENLDNVVLKTIELERIFFSYDLCFEKVNQKIFNNLPGKIWNLLLNENNARIIERLNNNFTALEKIGKINRGLITGNKEKYFSDKIVSNLYKPILAGRDVDRYFYKEPTSFIKFKRPKTAGGCWDKNMHFASHKILIRQIGTRPIATFINKKIAVTGNIFTVMAHKKDIELFITGILNSTLIYFYWSIMFTDFKNTFPQVTIKSLSQIPICDFDSLSSKHLIVFVKYILVLNKMNHSNKDHLIEKKFFEQIIDGMVFELYFEDEIKKAGWDILKYLTNLTPITDDMSDEQKMQVITKTFNELYDKNHPVRQNLEGMDEIEEVRIIKGLDQDAD
jgi:Eco57I restriction-modification methylase/TaqI-like C-terminal specificity domain